MPPALELTAVVERLAQIMDTSYIPTWLITALEDTPVTKVGTLDDETACGVTGATMAK